MLLLFGIVTTNFQLLNAQSDIKINGFKINHLDKQKRKQGEWVFFDKEGFVQMSCVFRDDSCISPLIFYEDSDTAFVKFSAVNEAEDFIVYDKSQKIMGNFVFPYDSTSRIEIEPGSPLTEKMTMRIKKYRDISIEPLYYFSQKKLIDYMSASFTSSRFMFNKPLNVLITISSAGLISDVEFPRDKNNLTSDEEKELHWIYSTMPRWQPFFHKGKTRPVKLLLSNNSTLSVISTSQ
jgi:hypothetical protein